jgi:hypothetical protein
MKDLTANGILAYKANTLRTEKAVKIWMKWRPAILSVLALVAVGLIMSW